MYDTDVLIAGAGPVGALMALGLARAGLRVIVLEREKDVVPSPRAMVYIWSVLEGLQRLGILPDMMAESLRSDDGLTFRVARTGEAIQHTYQGMAERVDLPFNLHMGQDNLVRLILRHLKAHPSVDVRWATPVTGCTQDADGVTVAVDGEAGPRTLRARYVVGADGARSAIRKSMDSTELEGITWPERFVATNLRYDFAGNGYETKANMVIDPVYGAVVAKIDDSNLWRVTYCEDGSLSDEALLEHMPHMLETILPGSGKGYELDFYSIYRMHQRCAARLRQGRILLAGDAAHVTNPTGGLGLTSGLGDVFVLYEALAAVVKGDAEDTVLDRYCELRRRAFLELASPRASNLKKLVYHLPPGPEQDEALTMLRNVATNDEMRLKFHLGLRDLVTPSLLAS
jgi:3-(3-hydroxy-phenyl)propionate hydroxylase